MTRMKESASERLIINSVRKKTNYDRRLIKDIYFTIFEEIQECLVDDGRCRIPFGRFAVVKNKYHCEVKNLVRGEHRNLRPVFRPDYAFKTYVQGDYKEISTSRLKKD